MCYYCIPCASQRIVFSCLIAARIEVGCWFRQNDCILITKLVDGIVKSQPILYGTYVCIHTCTESVTVYMVKCRLTVCKQAYRRCTIYVYRKCVYYPHYSTHYIIYLSYTRHSLYFFFLSSCVFPVECLRMVFTQRIIRFPLSFNEWLSLLVDSTNCTCAFPS